MDAAVAAGIRVVPYPGPSALLAALMGAGLGAGSFTFFGFLDRKGEGRRRQLTDLSRLPHLGVLYEAPGRVGATLDDLAGLGCGDRRAVVGRELTKRYEEFRRGTVAELAEYYRNAPPRGEVVIVVEGAAAPVREVDPEDVRAAILAWKAEGLGTRDVARALVERFGIGRNDAYRLSLDDA